MWEKIFGRGGEIQGCSPELLLSNLQADELDCAVLYYCLQTAQILD